MAGEGGWRNGLLKGIEGLMAGDGQRGLVAKVEPEGLAAGTSREGC